jgi:hypothetical protein
MYLAIFNIICFVLALSTGEIIAFFLFTWVRKKFSGGKKVDWSILKGLIERLMLLLGFVAAIPTVIVFFGAIKLGTRLKESNDSPISNDYFLIGNILSAIIVLLEYVFFQLLLK